MEGNKLELTNKPNAEPPASYKTIPEADMEEDAVTRPKSLVKSKPATPEADGADEKMLPKEDAVEVKVSPNEKQNGDAKLDIGDIKSAFVGLTKEELMKYANDPFWVRLRWFLFISFWLLWGLMLLGAIMIILAAPKCSPPPPRTWWEKGPIAEIDPDEINVERLKDLGAAGVIIPLKSDAYIDLDESHELVEAIKKHKESEINVIVELEPGWSQIWFNQSEENSEFDDFYIWQKPKEMSNGAPPQAPNNWLTRNNTSAWVFSEKRKEFYYAPTGAPHLNFRNPNVTQLFSEVIKKVIKAGADGVRLKGASTLLVDDKFANENGVQNPGSCVLTDYCFYTHSRTEHNNDLGPLLKKWRSVVKNITDNGPFMIREDISPNIESYKVNNSYIIDLPLQTHFKPNLDIFNFYQVVQTTFNANNMTWPLWEAKATEEWDVITYLLPGAPLIGLNSSSNKDLLKVRTSPSIMRGPFKQYLLNNNTVYAFTRVTAGNPGFLVAYNPSESRVVVDFPTSIAAISEEVTIVLFSQNYNETGIDVNIKHEAKSVPISPKSAIVLSYVPKDEKKGE